MASAKRIEEYGDAINNPKPVVNPNYVYKPRDSDIIVVGVMKSGTTWLQQILHQIRTKGDESFDDIYNATWFLSPIEDGTFNFNGEQMCNPRILKHHNAYDEARMNRNTKHIVIYRDPYDAIYSFAKFFSRFFGDEEDTSDEDMAAWLIKSKANEIRFRNMASWWKHRNDPNVMVIFYEDMKKQLKTTIEAISHFVGIPLTDDELTRVTHLSSFEYMSQHKEKFQGESVVDMISQSIGKEAWAPKLGMVRSDGGKVGQGVTNVGPKVKGLIEQSWLNLIEKDIGFKNYQDWYKQHGKFVE